LAGRIEDRKKNRLLFIINEIQGYIKEEKQ